jgi:hypothetical protein
MAQSFKENLIQGATNFDGIVFINEKNIMTKFQNILTRFKDESGLQILDQNFSNEIIFDRKLST